MNLFELFLILLSFVKLKAADSGKCVIEEVTDSEWNSIKVLGQEFEQNVGIDVTWHNKGGKLLTPSCENFIFSIKDEIITINNAIDLSSWDNYETYEISPKQLLCNNVVFNCGNVSELNMDAGVLDTNDYPPEFLQTQYEMTIPMPLIPKVDISPFMETTIQVRDKDFSNENIDVTIDPPDFKIEVIRTADKSKTFNLKLTVNKLTRFDDPRTYVLTAKDSGKLPGPLTTTVPLVINVDYAASEPVFPKFSKSYYKMTYTVKDGKGKLEPSEDIKVTAESDSIHVALEGDEDITSHFTADYNKSSKTVSVSLKDDILPDDVLKNKDSLFLTLLGNIAEYNTASEKVAIVIDLPNEEDASTFTEAYYRYSCSKDGTLKPLETQITVTDKSTKVSLESKEYADYFKVTQSDADSSVWNLVVQDMNGLKKVQSPEIALLLRAKKDGVVKTGTATLLVSLPVEQFLPWFEKLQYNGKYETTDTVTLSDGPIKIMNSQPDKVKVNISGDYSENFKLMTTDNHQYTIVVNKPPEEALKTETSLTLLIEAVLNEATSYATVTIKLPERITPAFTEFYYTGTYDPDSRLITLKNGPIALKNKNAKGTQVSLAGDDKTYFKISKKNGSDNEYEIEASNLPTGRNEYIVILNADLKDIQSSSTLIMTIPGVELPTFSHSYYNMTYNEDDNKLVIENGPIELTDPGAEAATVKLLDDMGIFKLSKTDKKYDLSLLPDTKLDAQDYALTLEANLNDVKSYSTVIVSKESKEVPKFSNMLYKASYDIEKKLIDKPTIVLVNAHVEDTDVSLSKDSKEYFTVNRSQTEKSQWIISTIKDLPLSQKNYILNLEADLKGVKGYTSFILTVSKIIVPSFSMANYEATYDKKTKTVTFADGLITLTNSLPDQTKVTLIESDTDFQLAPTDPNKKNEFTLTVQSSAVLNKKQYILGLKAELASIETTAGVTVNIPEDEGEVPTFSSINYVGSYQYKSGDIKLVNGPIKISNPNFKETLVELLSETDKFEISPKTNTNEWAVSVKSGVTLQPGIQYVLSLRANLDGIYGFATLVVIAPEKEIPEFSNVNYQATYQEKNSSVIIGDGPIQLKNPSSKDTQVTLTSETDKFELSPKTDTNEWDVSVKSGVTLQPGTQYVLSLKANLDEKYGFATLVVIAPEKEIPEFSNVNYKATYQEKNSSVIIGDGPIQLKNPSSKDTQVTLTSETEKFEISPKTNTNEWAVSVKSGVTLQPGTQYVLSLRANLDGIYGFATLVVIAPEKEIPEFSNVNYKATYEEKTSSVIIGDGPIQLKNPSSKDTQVTLTSETSKFEISKKTDANEWDVSVKSGVTLPPGTQYILSLKADLDGIYEFATLVVITPEREIPQFSQAHYSLSYNSMSTLNVQIVQIELVNKNPEDTDITLDAADQPYLDLSRTPNASVWEISVKKVPENTQEMVVTLKASLNNVFSESTLIVHFTGAIPILPQFSQEFYEGYYKVDGPKPTVSTKSAIKIISKEPENTDVTVSADEDYKNYFTPKSQDKITWSIEVNKQLPDSITDKGGSITVVLEATYGSQKSSVPVIINLPEKTKPPSFERVNYVGDYKAEDDKIDTIKIEDGPIRISSDKNDLDLHISGEYSENIQPDYSDGQILLQVSKDLDTTSINESFLVWTLEVSYKGKSEKSSASIVVSVPANGNGNNDGQHGDGGNDKSGLLAAVGVLVFIVIGCLAALGLLYFFKIRKGRKYSEMDDDSVSSNDVRFSKNSKSTSNGRKSSSVANRRPTGFIRYSSEMREKDDADAENENKDVTEPNERRKSVAFDENVSKLQIEPLEQPHEEVVVTTQL